MRYCVYNDPIDLGFCPWQTKICVHDSSTFTCPLPGSRGVVGRSAKAEIETLFEIVRDGVSFRSKPKTASRRS